MFCHSCGKEIKKTSEYCSFCGSSVNLKSDKKQKDVVRDLFDNKPIEKNANIDPKSLARLNQTYKATGILSISLGLLGIFIGMFVGFDANKILTDLIVVILFQFPRIYFGKKILDHGTSYLNLTKNITKWMLVYSIFIALVNIFTGSPGWLFWILIYFYALSYMQTKNVLNGKTLKSKNNSSKQISKKGFSFTTFIWAYSISRFFSYFGVGLLFGYLIGYLIGDLLNSNLRNHRSIGVNIIYWLLFVLTLLGGLIIHGLSL